jgi:uncharacterized lipoprotein YmbA
MMRLVRIGTGITHPVELAACSLGLSATSQQYFSLRTNQLPATRQQYFSLRINQHQPSATSQTNRLLDLDPLLYERFFFKENWFVNVVGTWKHPPSSMDFALG